MKLNEINKGIQSLSKSENNVKEKVSELSRGLLVYIVQDDSGDIDSANRLIDVLTPVNRKVAIQFFSTFLPYQVEYKGENKSVSNFLRFGKKMKKGADTRYKAAIAFLRNKDADLWTWSEVNVKVEKRDPDYVKNIQRNVVKALEHKADKGAIVSALIEGGLKADDILSILGNLVDDDQPQEQAA